MSRDFGYVPFPQVNERSEHIMIHELGLPVGLDIERLELNVPRVERIIKYGDIGSMCIFGFRGETTERGFGVGGMSADGSATAAGSGVISKAKSHSSEIMPSVLTNVPEIQNHYNWKHAHVKFNNAEIEDRIKTDGDKWDRGPYDVFGRARYMNRSLKSGLAEAAKASIIGEHPAPKIAGSMFREAIWGYWGGFVFDLGLPEGFAAATVMQAAISVYGHRKMKSYFGDKLEPRQLSLGRSVHYDRLAVSTTLATTSKLIRARK